MMQGFRRKAASRHLATAARVRQIVDERIDKKIMGKRL